MSLLRDRQILADAQRGGQWQVVRACDRLREYVSKLASHTVNGCIVIARHGVRGRMGQE